MKQLATVVAGAFGLALALSGTALAGSKTSNGAVFALTNSAQGNAVAVYDRSAVGTLDAPSYYATGGLGTGAGLGSQGAIALTGDGQQLLAVNAGDNTVSAFAVEGGGLRLLDVVPSGGVQPTSVTVRNNV